MNLVLFLMVFVLILSIWLLPSATPVIGVGLLAFSLGLLVGVGTLRENFSLSEPEQLRDHTSLWACSHMYPKKGFL